MANVLNYYRVEFQFMRAVVTFVGSVEDFGGITAPLFLELSPTGKAGSSGVKPLIE